MAKKEASIVALQGLKSGTTLGDTKEEDGMGEGKRGGNISRRKLARNALLIGAGAGTSILRKPLKQAKAAAKATAKVTVKVAAVAGFTVVQTPPPPMPPSLGSVPNAGDGRTTGEGTVQRQADVDREETRPWRSSVSLGKGVALPAVGAQTKRMLLVRHGQTDFNKRKICQGRRLNPPLNDEGREQARQLLPNVGLDAIVCSPLRRARETAAIVQASHPGTPVTVLDNLNEVDFGGAEGLPQPLAATVLAPSYMAWKLGRLEVRSGRCGESGEELQERAKAAAKALLNSCNDGGQVLAVSHSSMIKFMLASLLGVPLSKIRKMGQGNCAVNALDFDAVTGVCEAVAINDRRASGRGEGLYSEA